MHRVFSITALLLLLTNASLAEAYLDPSTGSMIISAVVGIFASITLALKTYWYRLKRLFRRNASAENRVDEG